MRLILFLLLLNISCVTPRKAPKECKKYFTFLKSNWKVVNSNKLTYTFKENSKYGEEYQYKNVECFNGLSERSIKKILGEPSVIIKFYNKFECHYCFEDDCLKKIMGKSHDKNASLIINYTRDKKVINAKFILKNSGF